MTVRDNQVLRYTSVAVFLHWSIAVLIIFNLALGPFMEAYSQPLKLIVIKLHISSGMTVLALTMIRILWRLSHRPPPLFPELQAWERLLAHVAHGLLYILMLGMPVTGWLFVSANQARPGNPLKMWGLIDFPRISALTQMPVDTQKPLHDQLVGMHSVGGWIMLAVVLMHVAGALKHQLLDGYPQLSRMGFGPKRPS